MEKNYLVFVDSYGKDKKYFLITTMNLRLVEFSFSILRINVPSNSNDFNT